VKTAAERACMCRWGRSRRGLKAGADEDFIVIRTDIGIGSYYFFFYSCSSMPYE